MRINTGINIAKDIHRVTAIDSDGVVNIGRKVENHPTAIAGLVNKLMGYQLAHVYFV